MTDRGFKDRLYQQFARVGSALSSEKRLELLDLLAQAPRNVEALASETGMSVANTSQHLQALRSSRLVEGERRGTRITYRLASEAVLRLWLALRSVAEAQLADVGRITREFAADREGDRTVSRDELERLLEEGSAYILDVRPRVEYESGHIRGAVTMPLDELPRRLAEIPRDRPVTVYCRGEYCLLADDAVAFLRAQGIDASRLGGGWPEWLTEGREAIYAA